MTHLNRRFIIGVVLIGLAAGARLASAESMRMSDEQFGAVQTAFLQENFTRVVDLVRPFMAEGVSHPQAQRVWLWYVLSLDRLNRSDEALQELDRLKSNLIQRAEHGAELRRQPLWPEVLYWEAEISRRQDKMLRARMAYELLLQSVPESTWRQQARLGLGLVLLNEQDLDAAASRFAELTVDAAPNSSLAKQGQFLLAVCDVQRQDFTAAIVRLRRLLEQSPDLARSPYRTTDPATQADLGPRWGWRAQVQVYLADALAGLRQFDDAAALYRQIIDAQPQSRWAQLARFGLGWIEFQQGRCEDSLKDFAAYRAAGVQAADRAESFAPPDSRAELLFAEGRCLMAVGGETEALARFRLLRQEEPEHDLAVEAGFSIGELLEREGRYDDALAMLDELGRQAFEIRQIEQAQLRAAAVAAAAGRLELAAARYQQASASPEFATAQAGLNGLGDVEARRGRLDAAEAWYRKSIDQLPTSQAGLYASFQLGRLQAQAGKTADAIATFKRLCGGAQAVVGPHAQAARRIAVEARLALAFTYVSQNQPELARAELEFLRAQDHTSPEAARAGYYLAVLAGQDGRVAEARQLCDEVIRQAPTSQEAMQARLMLAEIVSSADSPQQAMAFFADPAFWQHLSRAQRSELEKKLGDIARQARAWAAAIHWYELAWQDAPSRQAELDYRIASCYEAGGDAALAAHRYRAIAEEPWRVRGQLAAAKLMERQERWPEAIAIYDALTRQGVPESKIAQERLMALQAVRSH